jgi:putative restriction endonuclease
LKAKACSSFAENIMAIGRSITCDLKIASPSHCLFTDPCATPTTKPIKNIAYSASGTGILARQHNGATMPTSDSVNWTRPQILAALHLYFQLPYGQLHKGNPRIKQLASWIDRTPSSAALKLTNIASLDPQIIASGRKGMKGASKLDRAIWQELQSNWDAVALEAAAEYEQLATRHGLPANVDVIDELPETLDIPEGKTRLATVEVRVNQARFRKAILASYNATCCISGLQHEKLVIASHILPWSDDKQNRMNPQNGLCLSALHDKAYDQGLITVMPDYTVRVSATLKVQSKDAFLAASLLRFDKQSIRLPERFRPEPAFLAAHAERFGFLTK